MITEEKIKSVQKQLRRGEPQGEIKNELRREGYSEEDIEMVFVAHKPDMRSWYLVCSIIFFVVGACLLVTQGSFLFLVFAAAMYSVYYIEKERIKKKSA
ncbi:MAG: hypothetical protein IPL84_16210 [Chitinophagaceae bacterium]|nr:hypothetical protein [Chitinophagaceae bacterium]